MKTNFKYLTLAVVSLLLGFSSCSSDDENGGENGQPKSVTVRILNPSTYAEEATAVGQTPDINDMNVYFIGNSSVLEVGTMTTAEVGDPAGKTFTNVPGTVSKVVVVGNATALMSPSLTTIVVGSTEAALNAIMFEQDKQTDPTTAVNVYGGAVITGASGSFAAAITVAPAISRIEIAKVEAKAGATIVLSSFKLTGVYINNTYTKLGTDYTTLPTAAADILNYDGANAIWGGAYPARYCDLMPTAAPGTSFTPTVVTERWSYYIMPPVAGKGTTIASVAQTSVPHIILKIEDATATGYTLPNPAYVTIKDLKLAGTSLTFLDKGKVYSLATIAIGGENLAAQPEVNAQEDVAVTVSVTPWTNVPVTPGL